MIKTIATAMLVMITLTACIPELTGPGFTQARAPNHRSIRVGPIPLVRDRAVIAPWNRTAGRVLFRRAANPQVVFRRHWTPIIAPDGTRRAAWVQRIRNPDQSIRRCIIHWDPHFADRINAGLFSHEGGHCLDFPDTLSCSDPYRGVMAYCTFWWDRSQWWGRDDRIMLRRAGYS